MGQGRFAVLAMVLLFGMAASGRDTAPAARGTVPPNANTTDPSAPFHIDLTGLDLRTSPPVRDPRNPHYPPARELPDGQLPPGTAAGNFIIGPTHVAAPETIAKPGVARGTLTSFTLSSDDSVIYRPGIARDEKTFNASIYAASTAPGDPSNVIVTTSRPAAWVRTVHVYVPAGYKAGQVAPLLVVGDGEFLGGGKLVPVLDNLIAQGRIPPLVAVFIGSGGQDAQGSQRGREYDAMSGTFAAWVESEVLPVVEKQTGVTLTHNPAGRAAMGGSSAGVAAFTMAWFRPDLYRRVLAYSPTFVNQQYPHDPALPGGAWQYHSPWAGPRQANLAVKGFVGVTPAGADVGTPLVPASSRKPIRFWYAVGDRDLFYPIAPMADGMHDWVLASENMARALAARQYDYQFVFARNAGHVDQALMAQTLPAALEWLWADYPWRGAPRR